MLNVRPRSMACDWVDQPSAAVSSDVVLMQFCYNDLLDSAWFPTRNSFKLLCLDQASVLCRPQLMQSAQQLSSWPIRSMSLDDIRFGAGATDARP